MSFRYMFSLLLYTAASASQSLNRTNGKAAITINANIETIFLQIDSAVLFIIFNTSCRFSGPVAGSNYFALKINYMIIVRLRSFIYSIKNRDPVPWLAALRHIIRRLKKFLRPHGNYCCRQPIPVAGTALFLKLLRERCVEFDVDLGPVRGGVVYGELARHTVGRVRRQHERGNVVVSRILHHTVISYDPVNDPRGAPEILFPDCHAFGDTARARGALALLNFLADIVRSDDYGADSLTRIERVRPLDEIRVLYIHGLVLNLDCPFRRSASGISACREYCQSPGSENHGQKEYE